MWLTGAGKKPVIMQEKDNAAVHLRHPLIPFNGGFTAVAVFSDLNKFLLP